MLTSSSVKEEMLRLLAKHPNGYEGFEDTQHG
jgi:hypothetical protein